MVKHSRLAVIRKILFLAVPLIISNIAMISMEVIDTIMSGQASKEDLAGLAIGGNIWLVIEMTMGGLLSAITPRIARFYGAGQFKDITHDTQQTLILGILVGVLAMCLMLSLVPFIPMLGATPTVTSIAQGYTQVIAYSLPISGVCWVLLCMLEGHGLMRFVLVSSLVAVALNVVLDYIFVFGKFGFPVLGGVGCAWTTTTIYWLWGFSCVIYTARHPLLKKYQIYARWPHIDWQRWRSIIALGLPISLSLLAEVGFFSLSALLIVPLGTDPLGAHQITIQVVSLVLMLGMGIGQATAICIAQSLGRSQIETMLDSLKTGLVLVALLGFMVGLFVYFVRAELPGLFTNESKISAISSAIMIFAPLYLLIDALQVWAAQTLRGFEDTKIPMIIQVISYWIIGFPLGYSLGMTTLWGQSYGVYGFWIGFFGGIFIGCCLLCARLYLKAHHYNNLVLKTN